MRRYKTFTGQANAFAAVAKSPARLIPFTMSTESGTSHDGSTTKRYVPTFTPATDEQRVIIIRAGFKVALD